VQLCSQGHALAWRTSLAGLIDSPALSTYPRNTREGF